MPYLVCDGVNPPHYQTEGWLVQQRGRYNKWEDRGLYCSLEAAERSPVYQGAKDYDRVRIVHMENL